MKRKSAERKPWPRLLADDFRVMQVETDAYQGTITLLTMFDVREPLWVTFGEEQLCIVAQGISWLQQFPVGTHHVVTTMFDAEGQVIQWYIDICKEHGIDERGIPWYDDLYLDVVVRPTGELEVLDVEELEEVLQQGVITPAEYDLAWREADWLLAALDCGWLPIFHLCQEHRELLMSPTE
jgi:predicted RNA-binding protein associated with RNAse of E/G family